MWLLGDFPAGAPILYRDIFCYQHHDIDIGLIEKRIWISDVFGTGTLEAIHCGRDYVVWKTFIIMMTFIFGIWQKAEQPGFKFFRD